MKAKKIHLPKYLKEKKKQHIIFDFDETIGKIIVDWNVWIRNMQQLIQKYEPEFNIQTLNGWDSWAEVENDFVARYGAPIRQEIARHYELYESNIVDGFEEYDTIQVIKSLSDVSISLWSSNARKTIEPILSRLEFSNRFQPMITRDEVTYIKPHHDGFRPIHSVHQLPLEAYLFIGNSRADERAAKGAGIDFLHVNNIVEI